MKTIYYVDAENVATSLINIYADKLEVGSTVVIFYSTDAMKFSVSDLKYLSLRKVNVRYIKCFTGKNAMDFQLISTVGFNIAKLGHRGSYVIISNDAGYDPAIKYWKEYGYDIKRMIIDTGITNCESSGKQAIVLDGLVVLLGKKGVSPKYATVVADSYKRHHGEELQFRMSNIRADIFDAFGDVEATGVWKKCHKFLKSYNG